MLIIFHILTNITQYLEQIIGNNVASCTLRAVSVSRFLDESGEKGKVNKQCQMHDLEKKTQRLVSCFGGSIGDIVEC